jgi:hypothetical protein
MKLIALLIDRVLQIAACCVLRAMNGNDSWFLRHLLVMKVV